MQFTNDISDNEENSRMIASERQHRIDNCQQQLQSALKELKIEEVVITWVLENRMGKLNNAFRAICWPGSPIMILLGIKEPENCPYLNEAVFSADGALESRELQLINKCLTAEDPYQVLSYLIYNDEEHHNEIHDDENHQVLFSSCSYCRKTLEDNVIREIRERRAKEERKYFSHIVPLLNVVHRGS
jgi:hypothetical protein